VGLHATDPATPYLLLWARLPGVTVADLDAELYQRRTLVKHLAMRRTLWMVRTEDLPLIHKMARNILADTMIGRDTVRRSNDIESDVRHHDSVHNRLRWFVNRRPDSARRCCCAEQFRGVDGVPVDTVESATRG
jgi:hypothetical protein